MKYYLKQKVFSWNDRFTIKDASGRDAFFVEGELFSWGKKLHVLNPRGEEVLFIQQKLWTWLPTFTLFVDDQEVALVRKELSFLRPRYVIAGPDWDVSGDVWGHDYEIREDGHVLAAIRKQWFSWGDSYELDILDEADSLLALGIILAIDAVLAAQQSQNSAT